MKVYPVFVGTTAGTFPFGVTDIYFEKDDIVVQHRLMTRRHPRWCYASSGMSAVRQAAQFMDEEQKRLEASESWPIASHR